MPAINKVILMGNLTADPELKTTQSGVFVTQFTVAVARKYAKENEVKADFFNIIAWRQAAEFVTKYFTKGQPIIIIGHLQQRSFTAQDGSKRYVIEVVADEIDFGSTKREQAEPVSRQNRNLNNPDFANGNIEGTNEQRGCSDLAESKEHTQCEELGEDDDLPF